MDREEMIGRDLEPLDPSDEALMVPMYVGVEALPSWHPEIAVRGALGASARIVVDLPCEHREGRELCGSEEGFVLRFDLAEADPRLLRDALTGVGHWSWAPLRLMDVGPAPLCGERWVPWPWVDQALVGSERERGLFGYRMTLRYVAAQDTAGRREYAQMMRAAFPQYHDGAKALIVESSKVGLHLYCQRRKAQYHLYRPATGQPKERD